MNDHIEARAAISAYIALAGIWIVLAVFLLALTIAKPAPGGVSASAICFSVTALWILWLRGFKLEIRDEVLYYSNGLYKTVSVPLKEIKQVKHRWIEWSNFGRAIKIPRLVIQYGSKGQWIAVNSKPFRMKELRAICDVLEKYARKK